MTRALVFSILLLGCNTNSRTPEREFINKAEVFPSNYSRDSVDLVSLLRVKLAKREASFYDKNYVDSTEIIVDTIIYNNEKTKIAFFIFTKNITARLADADTSYNFYYDGFCYLGLKKFKSDTWNIQWFNTFNIVNYYSLIEVKERIRCKYFNELADIKDTFGNSYYKYNLNDIRFWECPAWTKYF